MPFWGPQKSLPLVGPGGRIWSQLQPIGPPGLDSWSPVVTHHTLWPVIGPLLGPLLRTFRALRGPPGPPKGPFWASVGTKMAPEWAKVYVWLCVIHVWRILGAFWGAYNEENVLILKFCWVISDTYSILKSLTEVMEDSFSSQIPISVFHLN